jgi:hypothetical protein
MGLTLDNVSSFPIALPSRHDSPNVARHHLHAALDGEVADDLLYDIKLMASELVNNALGNGVGTCDLALTMPSAGVLRVAVSDRNRRRARLKQRDIEAETGRGLQFVDALSLRWGHHGRVGPGNTVWFEVDAGGSAAEGLAD